MSVIYLIRHGQSTWNAERRSAGQADPPLKEIGRQQAQLACEKFHEIILGCAGDTAAAAIALSLSSGADVFQAAEIANHASGIVIGKHGTATVNHEELIGSILSN